MTRPAATHLLLAALALTALVAVRPARAEQSVPPELRGIDIEERLGAQVPLDTQFVDHTGKRVQLKDYFTNNKPVILTLNYYSCATLCSLVLNGLTDGLRALELEVGKQFQVLTITINPREGTELARGKRAAYLESLGRPVPETGWPFLTGSEKDIERVASAVGFHYRYDEATKQYAHAAGIFVLMPDGRISRVLYGIEFRARDLRFALVEAGKGSVGTAIDRMLLLCYHYDPETRRYGLTPMGVMRIGGVLTMVFLGLFLLAAWRRERRATVRA